MDNRTTAVLAAGLVITILLAMVSFYLAAIAFILVVIAVMSILIMRDSGDTPLLRAALAEDARSLVITNAGNAPARQLHVALVPLDIVYDIPLLGIEASHTHVFPSMVSELKVVVSYENEAGKRFAYSQRLSATDAQDPLRPVIPLFGWK